MTRIGQDKRQFCYFLMTYSLYMYRFLLGVIGDIDTMLLIRKIDPVSQGGLAKKKAR